MSCEWEVWYNANNTTWTANFTVGDAGPLYASTSDTIDMDDLNAINMTQDDLDLGVYAAGTNSSTHPNTSTMENGGNIRIDVGLNSSSEFVCDIGENFSAGNLSYDLTTGTAYGAGTAITTSQNVVTTFNLDPNTTTGVSVSGGPTAPDDDVFWGIGVPTAISGGATCDTTVFIGAIMDQ